MPRIDYGAGLVIEIPEGMTILEASLQHGLDHQHMAQTCAALPLVSKSWRALKLFACYRSCAREGGALGDWSLEAKGVDHPLSVRAVRGS